MANVTEIFIKPNTASSDVASTSPEKESVKEQPSLFDSLLKESLPKEATVEKKVDTSKEKVVNNEKNAETQTTQSSSGEIKTTSNSLLDRLILEAKSEVTEEPKIAVQNILESDSTQTQNSVSETLDSNLGEVSTENKVSIANKIVLDNVETSQSMSEDSQVAQEELVNTKIVTKSETIDAAKTVLDIQTEAQNIVENPQLSVEEILANTKAVKNSEINTAKVVLNSKIESQNITENPETTVQKELTNTEVVVNNEIIDASKVVLDTKIETEDLIQNPQLNEEKIAINTKVVENKETNSSSKIINTENLEKVDRASLDSLLLIKKDENKTSEELQQVENLEIEKLDVQVVAESTEIALTTSPSNNISNEELVSSNPIENKAVFADIINPENKIEKKRV